MDDPTREREALDQLAMLADELLDQAAEIRGQWAQLAATLGVEPAGEAGPPAADGNAAAPDAGADPVRLVALDMMLAGSSRTEVVEHLRATFGEDVDEQIVDDVFRSA